MWGARRIHASAATEVPGGDGCHRPQHEQCAYVHGRLNDGVGPVSQLGDQHNECHKDKEQGQARDIYGGHPVAAGSGALLAFIPPEFLVSRAQRFAVRAALAGARLPYVAARAAAAAETV